MEPPSGGSGWRTVGTARSPLPRGCRPRNRYAAGIPGRLGSQCRQQGASDEARDTGHRPSSVQSVVQRPPAGTIPDAPGSYQFKDAEGRVIYVGKAQLAAPAAVELLPGPPPPAAPHGDRWWRPPRPSSGSRSATRSRRSCSSTASSSSTGPGSTSGCATTRATRSWRSPWPTSGPGPTVMRGRKRKGVRYFGPYGHAYAIRETLDLLLRTFPLRTCSDNKFGRHEQLGRPCLLFHIEKCSGPCVGEVDHEAYDGLVARADRLPRRRHRHDRPPARGPDAGGGRRPGVRAGRPPPRPAASVRKAIEKPADGGRPQRGPRRRSASPRTTWRPPSRCSTSAGAGSWAARGSCVDKVEDLAPGELVGDILEALYDDPPLGRAPDRAGPDRARRPRAVRGVAVPAAGVARSTCGSRSGAPSGSSRRPSPATPGRSSPATGCGGPATTTPGRRRSTSSRTLSACPRPRCGSSATT